jgi:hypothetical protein
MKKAGTSRGKLTDTQRGPTGGGGAASRPRQESSETEEFQVASGEMTLGGHADRGLTLAAIYDTGVLERLRLEVRVRIMVDLTVSLSWLHANPRLMASQAYLVISPATIVIGLDGVARVDVRAAKKRSSEFQVVDPAYAAPELLGATGAGDHRADIYSLGVLAWEALAGQRLGDGEGLPLTPPLAPEPDEGARAGTAAKLASPVRIDRDASARRKPPLARTPAKTSHARLKLPPLLTLPADGEWALPLLDIALQAMQSDVNERPQDCRLLLARLEALDTSRLASHQEIAEVVQGISAVATLCVPEARLPDVDAPCISESAALGLASHNQACFYDLPLCANPRAKLVQELVVEVPAIAAFSLPPALGPAPIAPLPVPENPLQRLTFGHSARAWALVGLLSLATLGLVAGYVASVFAAR